MAQTKLTIRVDETRGSAQISWSSTGRVAGLLTAGVRGDLFRVGIPPHASADAYWVSVLGTVQAAIEAAESED